ncbi:hypothetical protein Tco_0085428 [Tanacetum coccineum]
MLVIFPSQSDGKIRLLSSGPQLGKEFHQDRALTLQLKSSSKIHLAVFVQLLGENMMLVAANQRISPTAHSVPLKLKGWHLMNSL